MGLAKRIISSVIVKDGLAVQSYGFDRFLPVGKPEIAVQFAAAWGADEVSLFNISDDISSHVPFLRILEKCAKNCDVPLSVGGCAIDYASAKRVFELGGDRIVLNVARDENSRLVEKLVCAYGSQAVYGKLDYKSDQKGAFCYWDRSETTNPFWDRIKNFRKCGMGGLIAHSVDRNGYCVGFDVNFVGALSNDLAIPVVAAGGYGRPEHISALFSSHNVSGATIGNGWLFRENSIWLIKEKLQKLSVASGKSLTVRAWSTVN